MLNTYTIHNQFIKGIENFIKKDPHLNALSQLKHQHSADWWKELKLNVPGIYILTKGRQIGKSTLQKKSAFLNIKDDQESYIFYRT